MSARKEDLLRGDRPILNPTAVVGCVNYKFLVRVRPVPLLQSQSLRDFCQEANRGQANSLNWRVIDSVRGVDAACH